MQTSTKYKLYVTSAALAVGCTVSYLIYKRRKRRRDAAELFDYLTINTVTTEQTCDQVVAELKRRCQKHRALGFDCEWVTEKGKRQPVALVQLSSYDGYCGLFRLNAMETLPASLKDLLEDETIYKVGVAPADDGKYLCLDYSVMMKSTLDVRHLAELGGFEAGGLATLSSALLGAVLDKSWRIRCSDWEAKELTKRQVKYAAIDAHVAIRIFAMLLEQLGSKRTVLSWLFGTNGTSVWSHLDDYCSMYADVHYKMKPVKLKDGSKEKHSKTKEPAVLSKRYTHSTRTKPLYNNCYLEAPDGELLCTCDQKKAYWFVNKELADVMKEDPLTVRLRFEPAGRSVGDVGRYYQLKKENKCVVCGSTNSYIRKNVVPREYRKLFPEIMKEHSSHDVVLLCTTCHQQSNMRDLAMRGRLADLCDAPLATGVRNGSSKFLEDAVSKKIKSAARALRHQCDKLPEARRKELEDILLQHYPEQDEITEELLEEASNITVLYENSEYESHGAKVVDYFLNHEGLLRLEEMWREHFLSSMKPRYMPELWSVKHNEERLRVKWNEGRLSQEHLKSIGLTTL
ncbi:exonuclease 3'-5' domain-containing protein 2 [Helicoverpa armigera]|uniref:exonuclease 3'-5' domain-containing protein 2 n=1 Tax=Helicoverpa armigera TaxID=29058 RepID=UPI003083DB8B